MKCPAALVVVAVCATCASPPPEQPAEFVFYPAPPDPPRIQFLRAVSEGKDVERSRTTGLDRFLFGEQRPAKLIGKPSAIAERGGVFYVCDTEVGEIVRIDFVKQTMDLLELRGRARLMSPQGMCFDADGRLYVADRQRRQVVVLAPDFSWERELGPWSPESAPTDVVVRDGRVYVADTGGACIRVLDQASGNELQVLGNVQEEEQYMRGPTSVAVDENGFVYAVDTIYSRIYCWDRDGKFVRQIAQPGDAPGYLARPKGLAYCDRKLWVLDAAFDNCQLLDLNGRPILFFGGPGGGPGTMSMPRRIWLGRAGLEQFADRYEDGFAPELLIAVTNSYGPRVSFYALGRSKHFSYDEVELPPAPTSPAPAEAAKAAAR